MNLNEVMKRRGWTQVRLAHEAGCLQQDVSMAVRGMALSFRRAEQISKAVDREVEVHELVSEREAAIIRSWRERTAKAKKEGGK